MTSDISREPTVVDLVAERWVDTLVELEPTLGTSIGRAEANRRLGDLSPEGVERARAATAAALAELESAEPVDAVDAVTVADLGADLRLSLEAHAAQLPLRDLNVIASPAQELRDVFDLMPTDSVSDWEDVAERLLAVPAALAGYAETLRAGIGAGVTPARRQVGLVAEQAETIAGPRGFFAALAADAAPATGSLPASLSLRLEEGAHRASAAYGGLARFLRTELAPAATEQDAVGREHYALQSRRFLGAVVDLDETYEWGIDELARMTAEQEAIAREILPGASVAEAIAHLDTDPARTLHGVDALQRWMQETSDRAVSELAGTAFDIPDELRRLECRIAPTQEGGIYYTGPSDDFSRPGRMWWSVPPGVTEFATWRELTTVYHEGVPGHHLQVGQAVYNRASLNTWRRQLAGSSGHAEGWALYAERLMERFGYLDDPADRLGMLDGQRMRAARVVIDIGVHLQKRMPGSSDVWTAGSALAFLRANVTMDDAFVRFEVNRYLGWPGQAPSYKIGQRIWEELRDEASARDGADFSLASFHRRALDLGGVGLDTLRASLGAGA
ncbi:DUF885 domain-containing protein [Rathayibacter sp. VKM Ac-2926]|uniref:DUF885 domain-containing protein n=1 Tax=Rathayibacter sp. VKM Ac-2926 TaxID=2929477 RepID=UPI001FB3DFA6|nr:DUF885 domain-containing protein [Rathayibacter sp. VKM Ac-2926]MCJ1704916.1 DUF885 domain-containing protein [Rathayibacter sp. VKM Ac-2926]